VKRFTILLAAILFVVGCPNPQTGKVDPYLTARTIINQASTALALSDGIFNQWLLGQTDADKAKKVQQTYVKVKTAVANGLQLALNGVAIAEQAKKDPNLDDLMSKANEAWDSLRKFLTDLFAKPEDAKLVSGFSAKHTPTSKPTTKDGISSKKSAVTSTKSPVDYLPKKLY